MRIKIKPKTILRCVGFVFGSVLTNGVAMYNQNRTIKNVAKEIKREVLSPEKEEIINDSEET